ncbi:UvrB/UvrC motif-containing protein [Anoxynatronum buryatiense]|uniref:Protein arginine kinase activator n=1 Tax=Anoxynatronum buryatiense TaxID=489973 RepID=A0AA45WZ77_9CLOT|nr:UvrB/UvrC motif-containing protein [Anoxynatronum buryatiense]SMP70010.1 protein arginine kinase activator [Anoxynatronum buryatiense]
MLCEHCHQRQAHVHVSQTVNGQTRESHLCETCALDLKEQGSSFSFSVQDFLKGFYEEAMDQEMNLDNAAAKKCSGCGQTYADYKRTGVFGCPVCYKSFRLVIMPLVKRIQGHLQHTGKVPTKIERVYRFEKKKQQLQSALKEAVKRESFEKAAELRDQIVLLEQKILHIKEGAS